MVLGESRKGIKISYCTDSRPIPELVDFIKKSDLFIGEGMYGDDCYLEKALLNGHMLFSECANLAKMGEVKELWLTHFSPLLHSPEEFLHNATNIFENTKLGQELLESELIFENL
jgi:ribonuclease Z